MQQQDFSSPANSAAQLLPSPPARPPLAFQVSHSQTVGPPPPPSYHQVPMRPLPTYRIESFQTFDPPLIDETLGEIVHGRGRRATSVVF